jgi:hypothetical protein
MKTRSRLASPERLMKDVRRVLETPFWIEGLETDVFYERLHDDHDGSRQGRILVAMGRNGDAWVSVNGPSNVPTLRFRTFGGGGLSPRVRNALMVLAQAIKLDNEERPQ